MLSLELTASNMAEVHENGYYRIFNWTHYVYRPFERTITLHKDSTGHVGFIFKNGKITSIVKDSSAARNGLLTEQNICEINGQNVIGLKVRNGVYFIYLGRVVFISSSKM